MTTKNKSPLRYPGGKTRAITILGDLLKEHYPTRKHLISPFLGGGSFELALQSNGYTVTANDLFKPLYTFWSTVKNNPTAVISKVKAQMPVTKEAFAALRQNINTQTMSDIDAAAAYFIINRCSFSGATFCGGYSQQAADGRLTESSLKTIEQLNLSNTTIQNQDCVAFLDANPQTENTVVYADPPYYITTYIYGKDGDMHEGFNHQRFAEAIKKRSDWMISYNDCEYIRNLYAGCRILQAAWSYGMNKSKKSSEIIILPPLQSA
jgi:DNA adenine methylase